MPAQQGGLSLKNIAEGLQVILLRGRDHQAGIPCLIVHLQQLFHVIQAYRIIEVCLVENNYSRDAVCLAGHQETVDKAR